MSSCSSSGDLLVSSLGLCCCSQDGPVGADTGCRWVRNCLCHGPDHPCGQQFAVECVAHLGGQGWSVGLLVKMKLVLSQGKTCQWCAQPVNLTAGRAFAAFVVFCLRKFSQECVLSHFGTLNWVYPILVLSELGTGNKHITECYLLLQKDGFGQSNI